ncbi:MAG TPA: HEAT repeat domain-containing protein [Longimicrobium sp.]|nr:HEAT repeat domain-containing protein [Longimicrobium sp.]
MSTRWMKAAAVIGALAVATSAACADAQAGQGGVAARVAAAPDGEVWMRFASRPGVCGGEHGISTSRRPGNRVVVSGSDDDDGWECDEGPVWVALVKRGGQVQRVRTRVARGWSTEGRGRVTDLGAVGARDASDYLLGLAERATAGNVGEEAIVPATLADSVTVWPALLRIARNDARPENTRRSAVFWLGQQAGEHITRELASFVNDSDEDRELRKHAVFALSQRPRDEAVPELVRIARTHRDPEIRKAAMFWLGQSGDPRALALFEEILRN